MEKILAIIDTTWRDQNETEYEGFIIKTDKQEIKIGIDNESSCCESWGHLISEDIPNDFIGSELLEIKIVDTALNTRTNIKDVYDGGIMFVNFETTKGTFQIVAYNSHNGYYSHDAVVISRQLNHSELL